MFFYRTILSILLTCICAFSISAQIAIVQDSIIHVNCKGDSTGALFITVSGGAAPYTYSWANGDTTEDITNIPYGTYTLSVTDSQGYVADTTFEIQAISAFSVTADTVIDVICRGDSTGEVYLSVSGDNPPFSFLWETGDTTSFLTGVPADTFIVTVTDTVGCSFDTAIIINEPDTLAVNLDSMLCIPGSTGDTSKIYITVTGGTPPYQYIWSNGIITQDCIGTTDTIYELTVVDACNDTLTPSGFSPCGKGGCLDDPLKISGTTSDAICGCDGSIGISVSGGEPPYSYLWSNGETSASLSSLCPGSYSVKVIDAIGCYCVCATFTVGGPSPIVIENSVQHVSCNGNNTGSIDITPSPDCSYTYQWSNGATTQNISNLQAGTYTVTVNGQYESRTLSVEVQEPPPLSLDIDALQHISCYGDTTGAIDITVSGGTPAYSYSWSNGENTQDLSGLRGGNYSVTVTDTLGCSIDTSITVNEPPLLTLTLDSFKHIACNGDSTGYIHVTVSGGTPPYNYSWSNGAATEDINSLPAATYMLTVTDSNSCIVSDSVVLTEPPVLSLSIDSINHLLCNGDSSGFIKVSVAGGVTPYDYLWNTGEASEDITGISGGNYTLSITDQNNCHVDTTVVVNEPSPLDILIDSILDVSCNGSDDGSIYITPSGGIQPYSYYWTGGDTIQDINNIDGGAYTVVLTDSNACRDSISVTVKEPASLTVTIDSVTDASCNGANNGAVHITVTGGTTPYAYSWSNGENTEDITSIPADFYTLTVTDSNGCTATIDTTVKEPPLLSIALDSVAHIECSDDSIGAIYISVAGGTTPYVYSWSNGDNNKNLSGIAGGNYTLIVTDANNCPDTFTTTVDQTYAFNIQVTPGDTAICHNSSINLSVDKGNTFSWIPADYLSCTNCRTPVAAPDSSITYTVIATDMYGCSDTGISRITVNYPLAEADFSMPDGCAEEPLECLDESLGNVDSWYWDFGDGNSSIEQNPLHVYNQEGIYPVELTVTDYNTCQTKIQKPITVFAKPAAGFYANPKNTTVAEPDIILTDQSQGASIWYWDFGNGQISADENPVASFTYPGIYEIIQVVETQEGCSDTIIEEITVDEVEDIYCPNIFTPNNDKLNDEFIVKGLGLEKYNMKIFNRFGQILFETNSIDEGWDGRFNGRIQEMDTYIAQIEGVMEYSGRRINKRCAFTLIK